MSDTGLFSWNDSKKKQAVDYLLEKISQSSVAPLVKNVIVYGSVARGEDTKESDVDLLIFAKPNKQVDEVINKSATEALLRFDVLIEAFIRPPEDLVSPSSYFVARALQSGKQIYVQ
jgi:predicted nucleotidyltransferase